MNTTNYIFYVKTDFVYLSWLCSYIHLEKLV